MNSKMKNNNPDFIDNINGNTLQNAIKEILSSTGENEIAQLNNGELRIAKAYFSPSGFSRISSLIKNIGSIRLLLGSDPLGENEKWQKKLVKVIKDS